MSETEGTAPEFISLFELSPEGLENILQEAIAKLIEADELNAKFINQPYSTGRTINDEWDRRAILSINLRRAEVATIASVLDQVVPQADGTPWAIVVVERYTSNREAEHQPTPAKGWLATLLKQ